jgi:UDP-N-acetylmuramate dehydrogenase
MGASLLSTLPSVRGRYLENAPLKHQVWFRVGGEADVLFKPEDGADLEFFLKNIPNKISWTIIGMGSNLLIRDGGIPGVVIKLGKNFTSIAINGTEITAGGGALDRTVALEAAQNGVGGLEFFVGIPGTIGGAVKMNAGAYGTEVKDCLVSCKILNEKGHVKTYLPHELDFAYRHSKVGDREIVIEATFKGFKEDPKMIQKKLDDLLDQREKTQPIRARTGGSTFKNTPDQSAWKLIDAAGCRGLREGGAQVSEKHCNFLINTGDATAKDLESLGEEVRKKVQETSGIILEWEIKRIGIK